MTEYKTPIHIIGSGTAPYIIAFFTITGFFFTVSAHACTVSFGDWSLKRGDIVDVGSVLKTDSTIATPFTLSKSASKRFTKITKRYMDKPMPIHVGTYSETVVVRTIMENPSGILSAKDASQADQLVKDLKECL